MDPRVASDGRQGFAGSDRAQTQWNWQQCLGRAEECHMIVHYALLNVTKHWRFGKVSAKVASPLFGGTHFGSTGSFSP